MLGHVAPFILTYQSLVLRSNGCCREAEARLDEQRMVFAVKGFTTFAPSAAVTTAPAATVWGGIATAARSTTPEATSRTTAVAAATTLPVARFASASPPFSVHCAGVRKLTRGRVPRDTRGALREEGVALGLRGQVVCR